MGSPESQEFITIKFYAIVKVGKQFFFLVIEYLVIVDLLQRILVKTKN